MSLYRWFAMPVLLAAPLFADVTLRYKTELKPNPALPAAMAQQAAASMNAVPKESVTQLKDGKGVSSVGVMRTIVDFTKKQVTLLDSDKKRYSTVSSDELADQMAQQINKLTGGMPPEAKQAMAAMKFDSEMKQTGRTDTIQGIQAEERELVMTMSAGNMPNAPAGPMMKMVMQFWTAKDSETMRVPALRELKGYNLWAIATMNPVSAMEKMFQAMPGMGDGLAKMAKELQAANSVMLRINVATYVPMMAAMLKQSGQDAGSTLSGDSPLVEMRQEVSELSSATIPASLFDIPEGYQSAPAGDIIGEMMSKMTRIPGAK